MDTIRLIKIDRLKNLEYLDLKIYPEKKYRILKDNSVLKCNFNSGEHILHTEDKQYNTVVDLIINLSEKSQENNKSILRTLEIIESLQIKHRKTLEKLEQNCDFLKSQELEIDRKIQYLNNKFNLEKIPTKNEIEKLVKTITERPKELEIQTTKLIEKITYQIEVLTSEISTLKETIETIKEISLS